MTAPPPLSAPDGAAPARTRSRPYELGPMPLGRKMITVDEAVVGAPAERIFELARRVEEWPRHLAHYRFVRFRVRAPDGGGLVEMSANRPFGAANWPTWWLSEMSVDARAPEVRFRHVDGVTRGMDVAWTFEPARAPDGSRDPSRTQVRIVHVWDGPDWPLIGPVAALAVIGPVFVHGIASRTLAGLKAVAERGIGNRESGIGGSV
jgi:ribosome-associated toxin RatA of RatAB toxin-antitoxin module